MPSNTSSLLKFQIGPVQDFIAQARSTRDLWSGSYLLSWLVAAGIKSLPQNSRLIFPMREGQPLLKTEFDPTNEELLIPNLPNIFMAEVSGNAQAAAEVVQKAITDEWKLIAKAVWEWTQRNSIGVPLSAKTRFFAQVDRHISISWAATALRDDSPGSYFDAYRRNGWHLDAVRQTRDFEAWDSSDGPTNKDSLSGKEEAVFSGSGLSSQSNPWHKLLHKHTDHLSAVALMKRVWHVAYLEEQKRLPINNFRIRSIPAIAARQSKLDVNEDAREEASGNKYIAAIAFDGDKIGAWVNGDFLADKAHLREHHKVFSMALSNFALQKARGIVEPEGDWLGQLIYAGGDDVLCLVPADAALDVAARLRDAFKVATQNIESNRDKPDASVGIAIAHIHSPLQDLVRAAQQAEKRAKQDVGRPAFSMTLMKRSGEISHWGSKWKSGGSELYGAIAGHIRLGDLSLKFPHRVCELLTPYLHSQANLVEGQKPIKDAICDMNIAKDLLAREFAHAASRQGTKDIARELDPLLRFYLDNLPENMQTQINSLIGLCTTVAFAVRTTPDAAEKQSDT